MAEIWGRTKSTGSHPEKNPTIAKSDFCILQFQNEFLTGFPMEGVFVGLGQVARNSSSCLFRIRVNSRPQDTAFSQCLHVNTSQMC